MRYGRTYPKSYTSCAIQGNIDLFENLYFWIGNNRISQRFIFCDLSKVSVEMIQNLFKLLEIFSFFLKQKFTLYVVEFVYC